MFKDYLERVIIMKVNMSIASYRNDCHNIVNRRSDRNLRNITLKKSQRSYLGS